RRRHDAGRRAAAPRRVARTGLVIVTRGHRAIALAMWDGHAAMIVRNSTMIEAGCEWEFT
ncbi:MAG: hypothetical protein WCE29_13660, partial [Mycobacterium sp.]